jgi:hypothetical protein
MRTKLDTLTKDDLTIALHNSGYYGNLFRRAQFDGWTASGEAIYEVSFLNEDTGQIEIGYIYVGRELATGALLAEF